MAIFKSFISRKKTGSGGLDGAGDSSDVNFVEFAENSEPRCACVLLLDVSTSMTGVKIHELKRGLISFKEQINGDRLARKRIEIAVVTFGEMVTLEQDFVSPKAFRPKSYAPGGDTPMAAGIERALDITEARKAVYKSHGVPYFCPWIFMITDGSYTDDKAVWVRAIRRVQAMELSRKVSFYSVGVDQADIETLSAISMKRKPFILDKMNFSDMFQWLSQSLTLSTRIVSGEEPSLPPADDWVKDK